MNSKTAFGTYVGMCENCRRMLYGSSKRYWVRFNQDNYMFCEYCVTVIEQKEETEPPKEET